MPTAWRRAVKSVTWGREVCSSALCCPLGPKPRWSFLTSLCLSSPTCIAVRLNRDTAHKGLSSRLPESSPGQLFSGLLMAAATRSAALTAGLTPRAAWLSSDFIFVANLRGGTIFLIFQIGNKGSQRGKLPQGHRAKRATAETETQLF